MVHSGKWTLYSSGSLSRYRIKSQPCNSAEMDDEKRCASSLSHKSCVWWRDLTEAKSERFLHGRQKRAFFMGYNELQCNCSAFFLCFRMNNKICTALLHVFKISCIKKRWA